MYLYIKAIHIISIVSWFAALFYLVRLLIYHTEANERPEVERNILQKQFEIMESRLYYMIAIPSMLLTLISGIWLMIELQSYQKPYFHVKLLFVVLVIIYHHICAYIMKQMKKGVFKWTSSQLRLWNEVATILLFAIVFIAMLKHTISWMWGFVGLVLFSVIIMMAVKIYKRYRE
jgi:putative membrane protein